jgi:hypothetical protein
MSDQYLPTHSVTVIVKARYPHNREHQQASVTVDGDGDIEHMLDTFRAALVAAGFSATQADRLGMDES